MRTVTFRGECVTDDMQCLLVHVLGLIARAFQAVLKWVYLGLGHRLDTMKTVISPEVGGVHRGLRAVRRSAAKGGRRAVQGAEAGLRTVDFVDHCERPVRHDRPMDLLDRDDVRGGADPPSQRGHRGQRPKGSGVQHGTLAGVLGRHSSLRAWRRGLPTHAPSVAVPALARPEEAVQAVGRDMTALMVNNRAHIYKAQLCRQPFSLHRDFAESPEAERNPGAFLP